ncbi:NADH:ubiquinone oxidoreductase [Pseudomonas matsuisoli]|uniref:NADH:ubiquinone oxidoreductase n=1 Tax=Pseudomonas matsuisoli TaxID=1515666 RepID=A0A917PWJ2_9PSED|nr:NADH:ubiquinone oxidoreductase [Pseudomonas matsuisoli]GGJ94571.1 hypothetical protein GCM10009304_20790 [Pseudomonas matsuisoli]
MRIALLLIAMALSGQAMAEACIIRSQAERLDVKLCQQNRTIPPNLFRNGFCQPQLRGQKVSVEYVEMCPQGAFGVCRDAKIAGADYRQDIHYYGVATDATYLKPACERQSQGNWMGQ